MNPLTINAVGPVTLSALSALRPVPTATNGAGDPNGTALLGLAQSLFQRALQVTPVLPLPEPATTGLNQTQEATASLLAALNAPQAAADTTPAAQARTTVANAVLAAITKANAAAITGAMDALTKPAAAPATPTVPTPPATPTTPATLATSPVANPAETVLGNLTPTQDALTNAASPDFALQTALRFGAGVGPLAAPATANPGQGTGLVRDATEVLRIRNVQPQTGGPGPEAFAQPQPPVQQVLQSYQAVPATAGPGLVDLFV
jgi:hypothetical protein